MADEIKLVIKMEGRGVTQLKGTVDQLKESLKLLAREPGISNNQRQQVAGLRRDLEGLINAQARYGKTVQSVNATLFSANKSGGNVRYGAVGTAALRASEAQKAEVAERRRLAILERVAQKEREIAQSKAKMRTTAMFGTIGFGGLQIGQQVAGMLENINFSSVLGPALGKVLGSLGGIFGNLFGNVLSNLGSAIGTAADAAANLIMSVFKGAFRAVGSLLSGVAMSLISVGLGGAINVVIGTAIGLIMAGLSVIQTALETAANLFKDFIKIVSDLLTAAFNIIKGLFTAIGTAISGIWNGIWDGLVATTKATWDVITSISKTAMEGLSKAFEDYAASQKLAARVFSQVSDVAENQGKTIRQGANEFREMGMVLSEKFAVGLNDATMGLYRITSAGITAVDSIKAIAETAGTMGVMSQHEDTFESLSNTLVKASQAYKISGSEINRFGAIISAATKMGSFDLKEYNAAIQSVIGSAAEAKVPFDQLNLVLALTSHAGLNLNRVTVGMNRLFDALTNPTKANSKAMQELGIDVKALQNSGMSLIDILVEMEDKVPTDKMRQMFGTVQGVRAFRAIKSQMGDMGEGTKRMTVMVRDFGKGLDEALGLAANRMVKTRNAWENFKTSMAGKLLDDSFLAGMDILDEIIGGLVNTVGKMDFSPITKAFSEGMKDVWNTVKQLPTFLGQVLGISISWETVIKDVAGYVTQISNYLADPKTWEGLVKGAMKVAGYLEFAGSMVKQMLTDTRLFDEIFGMLGEVVKNVGTFLLEIFKNAFEVSASYMQSTFLPVLKDLGTQFTIWITKGIGDLFKTVGEEMGGPTSIMGSHMMTYGYRINNAASKMEDPDLSNRVNNKQDSSAVYNALKPIIDRLSEREIIDMASVASVQEFGGKKQRSEDEFRDITSFLKNIKSTDSIADASMKSKHGGGGQTNEYLNLIYRALVQKEFRDTMYEKDFSDQRTKDMIDVFMRSVQIETDRKSGRERYGETDFSGGFNESFVKFKDAMNRTMLSFGPSLKKQNPEAYEVLTKRMEEINKIQFQAAEANTKATQENTNALTRSSEEKTKGKLGKDTRYDKLLPVNQVESYVESMRKRFPSANISTSGTVRTSRGYKQMVDVERVDTNAVAKSGVEAQENRAKGVSGKESLNENLKAVKDGIEESNKHLSQLVRNSKLIPVTFGDKTTMVTRPETFWDKLSKIGDVWEQF